MRESIIQNRIIKHLESFGWYVIKLIQTNKNGIPDLVCFRDGQIAFVEVKAEKNKPSALQQYRIAELRKKNIQTIIAYDIKDITQLCK